jgi:hypothetical protein
MNLKSKCGQIVLAVMLGMVVLLASVHAQTSNGTIVGSVTGSELNFLVLSEIAFDKKHQFAVVKYLLMCGEHCASGVTLVMEKVDGKWTESSRRPCALLIGY